MREPKVFLIARTEVCDEGMRAWLRHIGAENYEPLRTESAAQNLVMAAAKRCYMSFEPGLNPNVNKVRNDAGAYLRNILEVGHGSVLEHAWFSFAIEDVSRVFTGEMNRHRAGTAISEGSMRYIRFSEEEGIPFWMPASFADDEADLPSVRDLKGRSRRILAESFKDTTKHYKLLTGLWGMDDIPDFATKKYLTSAFRRMIGMGVSTGGVWSGNLRALRHILELRCAEAAEEEIRFVCRQILGIMIRECEILFGDFKPNEAGFWQPGYKKV